MLPNFFRRLFGFQQLAEAQRQTRIALAALRQAQGPAAELVEAQAAIVAGREQLAACRALLAVVMRERDTYEQVVEALAREVERLEQQRQRERQASRFWLTRTIEPQKVREN